jgi:hypothetical protein
METKKLNISLIVGSIIMLIITSLIFQFFIDGKITILIPIGWLLFLIWIGIGIFGAINFTKLRLWIKILISVVLTPVVALALFFLVWGITSGFKFTM